jgi:hypothetical protein
VEKSIELHQGLSKIRSKNDLASFILNLKNDLLANNNEWQNADLESFLDAMHAWILSMDQLYANLGNELPKEPSWKTLAEILYAAKFYE